MASTGRQESQEAFSVSLIASARVNLQDNLTGETSPHIIHAVSVTQPVQSWTVLRDHIDFLAMDVTLGGSVSGLPSCVECPGFSVTQGSQREVDVIIYSRNAAQEWLSSVLLVPAARDSPVMRQFLCYGANVVPPLFEGLAWVNFPIMGESVATNFLLATGSASASSIDVAAANPSWPSSRGNLDEMEMDDMFALDDDPHGTPLGDEDDGNSLEEDDAEYLQGRFAPTEEPLTQSEIMEIQEDYKQVEMVEDVGSLAQSLGASHLGRSLNLQREMLSFKQQQIKLGERVQQMQEERNGTHGGVSILAHLEDSAKESNISTSSSPGGIGGAMAKAENRSPLHMTQAHVQGLGDSFHRTAPVSAPRLDSFKMIKVIGKGSFGKVFLVREKQTNEMFALKVLKKDNIIKRNQVEHTKTERSVLGIVKHPFIVGLNMAFQSKDKLYFVLDYCAGGELFFHLGKVGKFSEKRSCFYAAEITLAIDYVHDLDIVYRDLKPENVLLDSRGHVRLTDFGLSKEGISNSSSGANSFCGTPEYLAPEILNRQGHGRAVDWWSLGALLYEMLTGLPPFYCRDREKLFEKIRRGTLDYPKYLSNRAQHILRGLLTKDPLKRLGSGPNDAADVQGQDFFVDLSWEKLLQGQVAPPWDPQINGSLDTSQFDHEFTNMPLNSPGAFQQGYGVRANPADNVFEGFTFTNRSFYSPPSNEA
mmetsp:Transcript_27944/g.67329  ORF Transcript_27944/g.67329 Transcript_27944/m.67329 type:complete len:704 (-) Transcript_27944:302-2413(-)|eukprot:CAMPEP_0181100622 /NCGR_PEP_ID=MMETSP1071-20121207/13294_1 /TAXON_ID=35127 /ORGANISM="Thalassiosira sp., Strain NH16" /LENGTH=703 /DNA_ID=CAMNT_0023183369 /DNA_START=106 /DNA_END=2217 /DNA_ORIENTATION=-